MNGGDNEDFDQHAKSGPFRVLETCSTFSPNTARLRKQKQRRRIATITKASSDLAEKRLAARDNAVRKIQRNWRRCTALRLYHGRPQPQLSHAEASTRIQQWFRRLTSSQVSELSSRQIALLRAIVRGHRTRRIMQSSSLAPVLRSLQDSYSVLHGLLCPSDVPPYTVAQHHHLLLLLHTFLTTEDAQRHQLLPPNCNEMFVLTLIREVLQCRRGICTSVSKLLRRKRTTVSRSKPQSNSFATPPRPSVPKGTKSSSPKPLKELLKHVDQQRHKPSPQHSRAQSIPDMRPATAAASLSSVRRHSDSAYQQQHDLPCRPATSASPSQGSCAAPARTLKRRSPKPCVVLHMMSAVKLIPAHKGPVIRDAYGEPVPDRQPGVRVSLMLPKPHDIILGDETLTSSPSSLKTSHTVSKDFGVTTLSPQWDHLLNLPLPLSDAILQHAIAHTSSVEEIPRYLLHQYWSQGLLKIEVVDGDRFNSEMFMGEATVHLSGFISPTVLKKASSETDALMISGTFPLAKRHSTDRVSGSVTLQAHLFLPEVDYIDALLKKLPRDVDKPTTSPATDVPPSTSAHDTSEEVDISEEMSVLRSHVLSSLSKRHSFQPVPADQSTDKIKNRGTTAKSFRHYENNSGDVPRSTDTSQSQNINRKSAIASVAKSLDVIAMGLQDDVTDALEVFSKKLDMKKGRMQS